jgi:hypothetical protein
LHEVSIRNVQVRKNEVWVEVKFLQVTWGDFRVKNSVLGKIEASDPGEGRRDAGGSESGGERSKAASHMGTRTLPYYKH